MPPLIGEALARDADRRHGDDDEQRRRDGRHDQVVATGDEGEELAERTARAAGSVADGIPQRDGADVHEHERHRDAAEHPVRLERAVHPIGTVDPRHASGEEELEEQQVHGDEADDATDADEAVAGAAVEEGVAAAAEEELHDDHDEGQQRGGLEQVGDPGPPAAVLPAAPECHTDTVGGLWSRDPGG